MPAVLMIQGKPETVFDYEQFARLLDEKLGMKPLNISALRWKISAES